VSRYHKGKTNLDFTGARDSRWQWNQLGHVLVCTSLQADNHTSTPPLSFLQAGCPSCRPTNSVKALKALRVNNSAITENVQLTNYTSNKLTSITGSFVIKCFFSSFERFQCRIATNPMLTTHIFPISCAVNLSMQAYITHNDN